MSCEDGVVGGRGEVGSGGRKWAVGAFVFGHCAVVMGGSGGGLCVEWMGPKYGVSHYDMC